LGIPIYSFPEYIFRESREKIRVIVGGSHGKTTTTSMIMHVLRQTGREFDYLVGARLEGFDQSVNITDAPVIVCEGDEYPASTLEKRPKFHFLFPHIAIITGIAWDHINVFPTFDFYL
jgi:UDP-N-acetylmuramate: L-alanyl-gamma-D-glutamyl-meso-diaminopimelate ligase